MNVRSTICLVLSLLAISMLFSQCQSSKIAYGNSYYFKQTPRPVESTKMVDNRSEAPARVASQGIAEEPLMTASVQRAIVPRETAAMKLADAKKNLAENIEAGEKATLKQRAEKINQLAMSAKDKQISRQERRAYRKELKKEMRAIVKDFRSITAEENENFLDDLDDNLRKAIIFWAIGLGLNIVAIVTPLGVDTVFWVLSSIAYLIGAVFFILWLVEELD